MRGRAYKSHPLPSLGSSSLTSMKFYWRKRRRVDKKRRERRKREEKKKPHLPSYAACHSSPENQLIISGSAITVSVSDRLRTARFTSLDLSLTASARYAHMPQPHMDMYVLILVIITNMCCVLSLLHHLYGIETS